ncbi:hypothetical protein CTheo_7477 [Ceratobasidium theobromae]|uniref:C2H2-type domain-containing protein n=1 Tax=Ceratobasidium theobromae TaxID=1582974 RepID=A0A5N5QCB0_9AGAM|nr:hypothetical protein CTheo_7477 [Ceratobasidium theobromae]
MLHKVTEDDGGLLHNEFYTYCTLCSDQFGQPKKIDRKNVQRHFRTKTHLKFKARYERQGAPAVNNTNQACEVTEVALMSDNYDYSANTSIPPWELPNMSFKASCIDANVVYTPSPDKLVERPYSGSEYEAARNPRQEELGIDSDDLFEASREQGGPSISSSEQESSSDTSDSDSGDDLESEFDMGNRSEDTYGMSFDQHVIVDGTNDWSPWPSKSMFLADLIMNSKRLKFTRRQMRVLLAYARETQGRGVPSLKSLKKTQSALKNKLGNPMIRKVSPNGNIFYMNQIIKGIAQDMANPYLRKYMNFYPHFDGNRMSEVWHGSKMLCDAPDHLLTPMIRYNGKIFYVNELVKRKNDWFLPLRWIMMDERCEPCAIGYKVGEQPGGLHVHNDRRIIVPVSGFCQSFPELMAHKIIPEFDDDSQSFLTGMPHPLRDLAKSQPVYSIPIILFMDDVSGNITRQWNKHISSYISNGALARQVLHSEYSVRFVLTSKHAEAAELMHGIREDLRESFRYPIVAFDCEAQEEVLIRPYPLFSSADNPMQAEQCSCPLQNANIFCRTCHVGGTNEFKQSEMGYATLFRPGEMRTPTQTLGRINALLDMSIQAAQKTRIKDQARDWGVKDTLGQIVIDKLVDMGQKLRTTSRTNAEITATLQTELEIARHKGCVNAFLDMDDLGFNVHEDTPTEILHTILLGVVKYFWGQTVFVLSKPHRMHLLETRLGSIDVAGLNIDSILEGYICHYTGSLIGKHFKILAQVMPFACYDLVHCDLFEVWLLLGQLTGLLWYTEINHVDNYLVELQAIIDEFLTAAARCSPSIIVHKPKFHFLVHLPMYIRRFGPAILFSTERFESFHGVFRAGSLFSNHHAPSRDIAEYFVGLDRLKHICSGGYWQDSTGWRQASPLVQNFISEHKEFSNLIGFPSATKHPGFVTTLPSKSPLLSYKYWHEFSANKSIYLFNAPCLDINRDIYFCVLSVTSKTGDTIKVGSNVLFQREFGQVKSLFACKTSDGGTRHFAAIKHYHISPVKHTVFNMPILMLEHNSNVSCIPIQDIICPINIQHDCVESRNCSQYQVTERQEREDTSRTQNRVQHLDDGRFVLNIHGLHNASHIRQALPPSLVQWRGLNVDPVEVRHAAVQKLAEASTNKVIQAEARKAAKNAFSTIVHGKSGDLESQNSAITISSSGQGIKRRRTTHKA